ncbi:nucleotidyltransferase family protein [Streptomyces sp. NPDC002845]
MKRARAVDLVEQMLHRLDEDHDWPLSLVEQVWLFGSFARGAVEPHDVDVAVRFERDERMTELVVQSLLSGRGNPFAPPPPRVSPVRPAGCSSSSRTPHVISLRPRAR